MLSLKIYLLLVMLTKYGIGRQNRPWPDVFSCRLHVSSRSGSGKGSTFYFRPKIRPFGADWLRPSIHPPLLCDVITIYKKGMCLSSLLSEASRHQKKVPSCHRTGTVVSNCMILFVSIYKNKLIFSSLDEDN
jgi:hypothetical protein